MVSMIIWGQLRFVPLRLDKEYIKAYKKLKKLQAQQKQLSLGEVANGESENCSNNSTVIDNLCQEDIHYQVEVVERNAIESVTANIPTVESGSSGEVDKLAALVNSKISERNDAHQYTLPDVACVRHNHNLLAVYCEGKIGEELVSKKGFIMPDGTTRQGVGEMAASVAKIGDKFRALKTVKITQGTTNNWANAIIYMLKRLSIASNNNIHEIWGSVSAIISDLCKVNKSL